MPLALWEGCKAPALPISEPAPPHPSLKGPIPRFSARASYFVAGINDGSLGSVIPYVMRSDEINTNMVSILSVT
ncbi:hypothetical protein BJX99DRAFT_19778 [Aspergillus californicus]